HRLAGILGLGAVATMNFSVFFTQVLYAFLGTRAAIDLQRIWQPTFNVQSKDSWPALVGLVLLFGFMPILSGRFLFGHLGLLLGALLYLVTLSFIFALRARSLSLTLLLVGFIALINCYPSEGHQLKLYGVVFGAPMLAVAIWPLLRQKGWLKTY